ncbi:hypothetical protein [Streptomyces sp. NPDC090054]|uniref:hypothetical protein n=1 Tax=Streptomyces sp. NPDC090054 TaxID=3365933 RepID=UPI003815578B
MPTPDPGIGMVQYFWERKYDLTCSDGSSDFNGGLSHDRSGSTGIRHLVARGSSRTLSSPGRCSYTVQKGAT